MPKFPHFTQLDMMDCGPTSLRIVLAHYGKHYSPKTLREMTYKTNEGVSLLSISEAAEKLGLRTRGVRINFAAL